MKTNRGVGNKLPLPKAGGNSEEPTEQQQRRCNGLPAADGVRAVNSLPCVLSLARGHNFGFVATVRAMLTPIICVTPIICDGICEPHVKAVPTAGAEGKKSIRGPMNCNLASRRKTLTDSDVVEPASMALYTFTINFFFAGRRSSATGPTR